MGFLELSFVLRLHTLRIEQGAEGIGDRCLQSVIGAEVNEKAIPLANILVHPSGEQPLRG
jgi:hypothetical protein